MILHSSKKFPARTSRRSDTHRLQGDTHLGDRTHLWSWNTHLKKIRQLHLKAIGLNRPREVQWCIWCFIRFFRRGLKATNLGVVSAITSPRRAWGGVPGGNRQREHLKPTKPLRARADHNHRKWRNDENWGRDDTEGGWLQARCLHKTHDTWTVAW